VASSPSTTTNNATLVQATSAQLNGIINPNGETTTGWFRYQTSMPASCDDAFGTRVPSSSGTSVGNGNTTMAYSVTTTGLLPGTTYWFCAIANNASGTTFGAVL